MILPPKISVESIIALYAEKGRVVGSLKNDARGGFPIPPGGMRTFAVNGQGKLAYETVRASVDYSVEVK